MTEELKARRPSKLHSLVACCKSMFPQAAHVFLLYPLNAFASI